MISNVLKQFGFSDKEASVYINCLSLGSQPVSIIAKKSGLKRTTTYLILENLSQRGLLSQHVEKNLKYFSANNPHALLKLSEKKKAELEENEKMLKDSLEIFQSLTSKSRATPKVRFYEGIGGIEQVMEDTLSAKTDLYCYTTMDGWFHNEKLKKYISKYCANRLKKRIFLRSIMADTKSGRKYINDYPKKRLWESRWLPKEITPFTNEINIYDDKIAICSLEPNEYLGIIIESKAIADTQRSIFELAWMASTPAPKVYNR